MVSVIIPTYNSKQYLTETVNSVLSQTYTPIDIIIVNDGSTDGTEVLFPNFEKQGITCYTQKNQGASAARNFGLSIAKGDYIQFLDADDILHPEKIERQVKAMEKQDADLSFTFWGNFSKSPALAKPFQFNQRGINYNEISTGKSVLRSFGMNNWVIITVAWLVRKDLILKAGYWNLDVLGNDDGEYFSRILMWAGKVVPIEKELAYYRLSDGQTLSSVNSLEKAVSALNSWKLIHALLLNSNDNNLLAMPKRGFFVTYLMTRKKYPKIAKEAAKQFDRIDVPCYFDKWKLFRVIKYTGLYRGFFLVELYNNVNNALNNKRGNSSK